MNDEDELREALALVQLANMRRLDQLNKGQELRQVCRWEGLGRRVAS